MIDFIPKKIGDASDAIMKKIQKNQNYFVSEYSKNNHLVYQHNKLIEAKYCLTLQEKRILLFCLSKIKPEDIELKPVTFSIKEFAQIVGISETSGYSELKKISMKLRNRGMTITDLDNHTHTQIGWLDHCKYTAKEGTITIQFHRFLAQFLLQLQSQFTVIPLSQTLGLSSMYAIRIFELLKQYEKIGTREITLSELREFCDIPIKKFQLYADIKRSVLQIAQRELANKTDISFSFQEVKKSRRVDKIKFFIHKKRTEAAEQHKTRLKQLLNEAQTNVIREMDKLGFSRTTIYKMLKQYGESELSRSVKVVLKQKENGKILNPKALFRTALQEGWTIDRYTKRQSQTRIRF